MEIKIFKARPRGCVSCHRPIDAPLLRGLQCAVLLTLLTVLCGVAAKAAIAQSPLLRINNAWIRAMPPGQPMTAAYLEVSNGSEQDIVLTAFRTPLASASLHETAVVDGVSTMRAVRNLVVPAGKSVALEPGGMHIMLMGISQQPQLGSQVSLCAVAGETEYCTRATVQRMAPTS